MTPTPGPWSVEIEEYETGSGTITIPEINRILHDPEWADPETWDRDVANAHLIAAAPEMYEALKAADVILQAWGEWVNAADMVVEHAKETGVPERRVAETFDKIRQALAKAEGK